MGVTIHRKISCCWSYIESITCDYMQEKHMEIVPFYIWHGDRSKPRRSYGRYSICMPQNEITIGISNNHDLPQPKQQEKCISKDLNICFVTDYIFACSRSFQAHSCFAYRKMFELLLICANWWHLQTKTGLCFQGIFFLERMQCQLNRDYRYSIFKLLTFLNH